MHAVRIVALAILAVLLASCSSRPTIQVLLTGEPELFGQIVGLRVLASVDDSTATRKTVVTGEPINGRFGVFNLVLPEAPTGILSVLVSGLRQGDCQVARGETSLPIEEALQGQVVVAMQATPEGCLVRVRKRGGGQGTVSDRPAKGTRADTLHCPATSTESFCQHQYTIGTAVRLIAEPEPGSVFLGWTVSNCRGRGPCDLVVGDDIQEVQARFESTRQCNQQYLCWENPLPLGNDLLAVGVLPDGDIWAVGAQGTILRREEGVWYVVPSNLVAKLLGVHVVSARDVWIVGQCGAVLHWDGEALVNISPLGPKCMGFDFLGVWGSGPDDVWLVGTGGQLWHWDGRNLGPVQSGVTADLVSIHGINANKFFIAGRQGTLLYRNGAAFQRVSLPDASADLFQIFIDHSNQVWATTGTTVLRGTADGSPLVVDLQQPGVSNLQGLWGTSDGAIWIAGALGVVMRRSSLGWETLSSGLSVYSLFTSIAGRSGDDLWLVGLSGLRMHWNGAYLTREQGGFEGTNLAAIHGSSTGDVWIGGSATVHKKAAR